MRNIALTLALTFVLGSGVGAAQAEPVTRIAAVINGDMITSRDLDKAIAPELAGRKLNAANAGDAAQIQAIRQAALENMINEKILMQEAEKLKISVSDDMVEAELNRFMADSQLSKDEFLRQLSQQGLDMDALKDRLRRNLISQMLIGRMVVSKVVVTDKEIADYYRQHMGDMPGGQVRVGLIIYPAGEDSTAWAARIASGEVSFEDVARRVSVGPNAADGGDLGFMQVEDLASALRHEVEGLKKGQVSPLFDMQVNKAQIRLVDELSSNASGEDAGQNVVPDEATAARIEELLRAPRLEARFKEYLEQLRAKALVDIRA